MTDRKIFKRKLTPDELNALEWNMEGIRQSPGLHAQFMQMCADSPPIEAPPDPLSSNTHTHIIRDPYIASLEAENKTLARQVDALHKWFTRRPDSDARDTQLAEWYARGQAIFMPPKGSSP